LILLESIGASFAALSLTLIAFSIFETDFFKSLTPSLPIPTAANEIAGAIVELYRVTYTMKKDPLDGVE
jgi:hypothetical protein